MRTSARVARACTARYGTPMNATEPKRRRDLITVNEAATRCYRDPSTIRRWLTSGRLTRYTFPTSPTSFIDPHELDTLLIATPSRP